MFIKTLIDKYKKRYVIPNLDLADSAESNRIHLVIIGPIFFLVGIIDVLVILTVHHKNLHDYIPSLIYFGLFTVIGIYTYIYSRWVKVVERERAYVWKTIPAYMVFHLSLAVSVYNFYILKQPYNGMVCYCLAGFISMFIFSLSPLLFSFGISVAMGIMVPGIYANFGVTGLMDSLLCTICMFLLSLYKRRQEKKKIMFLKKQKQSLEAKTFGNFTLIYEGKTVKFSRSKSEELIGYLIYKRGSSAKTKELISVLWGDHADSARYGSSLRNLIVDVKHTFAELEVQNFFVSEYNNFRINPEIIKCDYYDFLEGDKNAIRSFVGEFMNQYSWAEEVAGMLEMKSLKI